MYKVSLANNINYAFQINLVTYERSFTLDLLDNRGKKLASTSNHGDGEDGGFEFTARRSGVHYVRVTGAERGSYRFRAARDAAGSTATLAVLTLGRTVRGSMFHGYDVDYYGIELRAGLSYDFVLDQGDAPYINVRNAKGALLREGFGEELRGFQAPYTGKYFIEIGGENNQNEWSYRLTATRVSGAR